MSEEEKKEPQTQEADKAGEADAPAEAGGVAAAKEAGTAAEQGGGEAPVDAEREAKLKAAAEARAARAAAKAAAEQGGGGEAPVDAEREAKLKAAAEARAARAAAKAAAEQGGGEAPVEAEREVKLKAAAEARAARAAAKAAAEQGASPAEPKPPSPMQPELDRTVELLREAVGADTVEEAFLNELNGDMPTIVVKTERWLEAAQLLKRHEELAFLYLRNVSGVDYETYLEVVYHLLSLATGRHIAVKVRTDREAAAMPSATPVWAAANWNEREIYDLLGVHFSGHPDLRRIMMPDDWVGHPLRKDYEPLDSEV